MEEEGLLGGRTLDAQNLYPFKAATALVRVPGPALIWGGREGASRRSVRSLRRGILRLQISIPGSVFPMMVSFLCSRCSVGASGQQAGQALKWSKLRELVMDREAWRASLGVHGVTKSLTQPSN